MKLRLLAAFAAGVLFGAGLALSGMTDRFVVLGFLDIFDSWNPMLVYVMAGAVVVTAIGFQFVLRMPAPALGGDFRMPVGDAIDKRLIAGAAIFGIGWGLVGFCPGPVVVGLAAGLRDAWIFVPAMLVGSFMAGRIAARLR